MAARLTGPVAIIGLGCIGGSLARALLARGVRVRGWSPSADDRAGAARAGVEVPTDDLTGVRLAARRVTVAVLATPIAELPNVATEVCAEVAPDALVLHVAGLQRAPALGLDAALAERVIGTHPLAGSHETGWRASRADLFVGCAVSIESRAPAAARARAAELWTAAGAARIDIRDAVEHDHLMAWVSHLPQLASIALAATMAAASIDRQAIGTGARDTTRLAATPLGQWPELLRGAPADLGAALEQLEATIAALRTAVTRDDRATLAAIWERARAWRGDGTARP